jgi:hypothetical protein
MRIFMINFKPVIISYILPILAVLAVACGYDKASHSAMHLCKHQYALCTSAMCIPQPGDPNKAICFCDVEEGASMSSESSTDANGIRTVFSTFSLKQFQEGKKGMKCPGGTPWTWCLNKRCTVDPSNPKKAICVCDVVRTGGEWTTLGGNCNTSTCQTGYWSGATIKDFEEGNAFMTKVLGLDKSPAKWCQVAAK